MKNSLGMTTKTVISDYFWLLLLSVVFFGAFLGSYHLLIPDEGRYVEVAREMVSSGNFVTPHLDNTVFLDKPILFYWIESAIIKLLGEHEWSVRLLPLCCGVLGTLFAYWAGTHLYNRRVGILSALILMTSMLYFLAAHYTDMDLMVAVLIAASLWLFLVGVQRTGRYRDYLLWLGYIFAGLAFLTKGLMGIVFPAMIVGSWIVLQWRWSLLKEIRLISGLIIFLVVVMPWLLIVQKENPEFFQYFFIIQQFDRFSANMFNMQHPCYFYVVVILLGMLPWSIFMPQAIIDTISDLKKSWINHSKESFLLLWPLLIFIFFSIPTSKIIGYILPVFPPLALIMARYFDKHWNTLPQSRNLKVCTFLFLVFAMAASLGLVYISGNHTIATSGAFFYLMSMATIIMLGAVLVVGFSIYQKKLKPTLIAILVTMMIVDVIGVASVWTFQLNSSKPIARQILRHQKSGDIVLVYQKYYQDLPLYLNQAVYVVDNWQDPSIANQDDWRRELDEDVLYKHYQQPLLIDNTKLKQLWNQGRVFVVTSRHRVNELTQQVQPIYILAEQHSIVLLSNQPN